MAAKAELSAVDGQVYVGGGFFRHAFLHGVEHVAVFFKGVLDVLGHHLREGFVVGADVAQLEPVIAGLMLICGGHEIIAVHDEGLVVQRTVRAAGACGGEDRFDQRVGGVADLVMLQAVAIALEFHNFFVKRGGLVVEHPAVHDDAAVGFGDAQGRVFGGACGKAALVDPCHMGGVEQVVAHQQVVAVEFHRRAAVDAPCGVVEVFNLEDVGRVGQRGVAHPDPDQPVFFMQRVGVDFGVGGDAACARSPDAAACAIEGEAVVAAFDGVAFDAAFAEGEFAVGAGVFEGDKLACLGAKGADVLAKHGDLLQRVGDFMVPSGDVPSVFQEHKWAPLL